MKLNKRSVTLSFYACSSSQWSANGTWSFANGCVFRSTLEVLPIIVQHMKWRNVEILLAHFQSGSQPVGAAVTELQLQKNSTIACIGCVNKLYKIRRYVAPVKAEPKSNCAIILSKSHTDLSDLSPSSCCGNHHSSTDFIAS